jgi:hypothetical protein
MDFSSQNLLNLGKSELLSKLNMTIFAEIIVDQVVKFNTSFKINAVENVLKKQQLTFFVLRRHGTIFLGGFDLINKKSGHIVKCTHLLHLQTDSHE